MPVPAGGSTTTLPSGLCESWTPIYPAGCAMPVGYATVEDTAISMASEVLYALTARRFGLCTTTVRPCRRDCFDSSWWSGAGTTWLPYGSASLTPLANSYWLGISCGSCTSGCSCSRVSDVALPGPVYNVTQVKVDGTPLTKNVDYRLDDYRLLIRLGGSQWPMCNNLNLSDSQVGTWSVTFQQGEPVPTLGQVAVGELGLQFMKALLCADDCALPKPVQSVARQGVNITFLDPNEIFTHGRTGLYLPDLFIQTYNPDGRRQRAKVYNIDNIGAGRQLGTG